MREIAAASHRKLLEESPDHSPPDPFVTVTQMSRAIDPLHAQLRALQQRDHELDASIQVLAPDHRERRGLQGAEPEPEPEPEIGENVKIIKRLCAVVDRAGQHLMERSIMHSATTTPLRCVTPMRVQGTTTAR